MYICVLNADMEYVAGEKLPPNVEYYGVDQWSTIQNDVPSPRKEVIHNYVDGIGAIRYGNYKLLVCMIIFI